MDGHDAPCADGDPGGLTEINGFLHIWIPEIMNSPAYQQNGMIVITFDEEAHQHGLLRRDPRPLRVPPEQR